MVMISVSHCDLITEGSRFDPGLNHFLQVAAFLRTFFLGHHT